MSIQSAIIDLDGTVYHSGNVLDGVPSAIDHIRAAGIDPFFFSNNAVMDGSDYVRYLTERGIDIRPGEATSSGEVTTEYLQRNFPEATVFCIGAEGLREQFREAGFTLTDEPSACDVLVVSWTDSFDYTDMRNALTAIDDQTPFFGTDPDRTFQTETGDLVPGSGAIIEAVAGTVDRRPDAILGKPSKVAQEFALDRLDVAPEECLVVGDRLDTDLLMGERAGMTTVLVLTGVTDREDIEDSPVDPDYVLDSLASVDELLETDIF